MNDETVAIKGIKNGLLVTVNPTEEWLRITSELAARLDEQSNFFKGANVTVDLSSRPVPKHELTSLKALLERRGLTLWAVMTDSDTTADAAYALDLKTNVEGMVPGRKAAPPALQPVSSEENATPGVLVKRTIRSGRTVHSDGHVTIYGDVNPGSQIIAAGDVFVWGKLRGNVHAGANGDENAVVCVLDMQPTQLRIAGFIVTSPEDSEREPRPEVALIRDNQIVVESWR